MKFYQLPNRIRRENHKVYDTTRLSQLALLPVSFKQDTMLCQAPTFFGTTFTREGIERSSITTVRFRACPDTIQSLCSALFNLTAMISVIENGSILPKTTETYFCRHIFSNRRLATGYSTTFSGYPLPCNSK